MKQLLTILMLGAALPVFSQEAPPPATTETATPQMNKADIKQLNDQLKATQEQLKAVQEQIRAIEAARTGQPGAATTAPVAPTAPTDPTPPAAPAPPSPPAPPAVPAPPSPPSLTGGNVHIGSVMLTNNDYEVQKNEVVDGNVRIVHGDLVVNGIVNGDASTVTGDMEINGHVLGNAVAVSGDISLGPDAVVEGDVQSVRGDIVRAPGATVHGAIRNDSNTVANVGNGRVESAMFESPLNLPLVIVLMLAGMAMLVAWPRRVDTVGRAFVNRPGHSFVVGLASFPLAVLAIVISAVTIVGPVMVVFGFIGAFLMGVVAMALMLGRRMVLGKPYKSRFFPLLVGLGVWFAATVVSHVSTPLFVLMTISTAIAYLMAIGATLSTGFGKSPFWLRDRMAGRNKVGGSYIDPTQTYAGTADAFGDVI